MEDVNYYDVLGVDPRANSDEIRHAYRKKAATCHPDQHPNDAEAETRFKELTRAYEALTDPERRRVFDRQFAPIESVTQLFLLHPTGRKTMELMLPSAPAAAQRGPDAFHRVRVPTATWEQGGVVVYTLPSQEEITISISPDIRHRPWCRIRQQGFRGRNGAPAGDLWLHFTQEKE